ncbi:MAG: hypothetical protein FWC16_08235 [Defluviitaleaceae bacterium]|nr:hypothetical protein [Defluviitaleaceae bacterium]MCL2274898.1 hypothetical protein [Defluviitaleaceae bacterium]
MNSQIFILSDEVYNNGLFPQVPKYNKKDSWFILTGGTGSDIIVDDRTTVRQIRQGRYKRLVEISQKSYSYIHTFNAPCKETSYTFKVTVKANVLIDDPLDFWGNSRNINAQDFFNNQFSLDVRRIARNYSILDYGAIDDDLLDTLPRTKVLDSASGLAYQIQTVETTPNEAALKVLEQKEKVGIENYLKKQEMVGIADIDAFSSKLAMQNSGISYEEAIWGEVATGKYSRVHAIEKIDAYKNQSRQGKLQSMLELRKEGIVTDEDIEQYKAALLPELGVTAASPVKAITQQKDDAIVDDYFEED